VIAFDQYDIGEHRITCPACGRGPRDRTCGVTIKPNGDGVAHCHRCELVETYHPEQGARVANPAQPRIQGRQQAAKHETLSDYGRVLWAASKPLKGTMAADYLNARRCVIPPADGHLRFHPALKHPDPLAKYIGPALVALVTDALNGTPLSLHRTWITPTGKADVDPPRALLGGHRKQGGVVRLWPDEAVTDALAVAEGIETALSLAWMHSPAWSLIDAGNLAAFPVLPGVETLTIAADNDKAGRAAAAWCGNRWVDADRTVRVLTPKAHNDMNDILQGVAV
jgi:putative DNA primase/helicase